VIDPGLAPGTGTPEPGGMLTREVLRAIRQIVGAVDLCGMDIVEVSPPYDHAETTAMAANRAALEAISALAVKKRSPATVRWEPPARDRPPILARGNEATAAGLALARDLDLAEDPATRAVPGLYDRRPDPGWRGPDRPAPRRATTSRRTWAMLARAGTGGPILELAAT
jgi:hypothetical protein